MTTEQASKSKLTVYDTIRKQKYTEYTLALRNRVHRFIHLHFFSKRLYGGIGGDTQKFYAL